MDKKKLEDLKKKHGAIYQISVEGYTCIIRKPNRKDLSYISAIKDPIRMTETLMNQLWVEGDEEIRTDDELFLAAAAKMGELMQVKEAELKKL